MKKKDVLNVRFSVTFHDNGEPLEIVGEITYARKKFPRAVMLWGYHENWREWRGALPKDREEWLVGAATSRTEANSQRTRRSHP